MSIPTLRQVLLPCLAVLSQVACGPAEGRGPERSARYQPVHGQAWLVDRATKRIPVAHCELRVPSLRPLPEPITTPEHGDLLGTTVVTGVTAESAAFDKAVWREEDGWRIWLWRDLADASRVRGTSRLVIKVDWPEADGVQAEPAEVFDLPRLDAEEPWRWTPWRVADVVIEDEHAWHAALRREDGVGGLPAPEYPFEVRCRTVLAHEPVVPAADDDPTISRPEPGPAGAAASDADPLAAIDESIQQAGRSERRAIESVQTFLMAYLSGPPGPGFRLGNEALGDAVLVESLRRDIDAVLGRSSSSELAAAFPLDPFTGLAESPHGFAPASVASASGDVRVTFRFQSTQTIVTRTFILQRHRLQWRIVDVEDASGGSLVARLREAR
jgi:hypothetical protein